MGYKSSARGSRPVIYITGHTAEGAKTAAALGNYFWRDDVQASSHVGIDAGNILPYVPYDRAAWTLRGGNPISDNAEICGYARWTRAQWLSTGVVDGCANPRQMLVNFARWARERCLARGIPLRKLTVSQTRGGAAGVIHHKDYTEAFNDGTHWDMGYNVPWDFVLQVMMEDPMADSAMVQDACWRILALTQLDSTQNGGPGTGMLLPGIQHLEALVWRADAILNHKLTVAGGPTIGEDNMLAHNIDKILTKLEELENKVDSILAAQ